MSIPSHIKFTPYSFYSFPKTFFTAFFILSCFYPGAQNHYIDSLKIALKKVKPDTNKVKILGNLGWEYSEIDPDTSIFFNKQALSLAEKLNYRKGISRIYNDLGWTYFLTGEFDTCMNYYQKSIQLKEILGDKKGLAGTFHNIAIVYSAKTNYPEALNYYLKALKLNEETGNDKWKLKNLSNIAGVYYEQGDFNKALEYYLKSLRIEEKTGKASYSTIGNIGNIYFSQQEYPKALENYLRALKLYEETGHADGISVCLMSLGNIFEDKGQPEKALEHYNQAFKIIKQAENRLDEAIVLGLIGKSYFKQKDYQSALKYTNESLAICDSFKLLDQLSDGHLQLSEIYGAIARHDLAYTYYKKHIRLRDSIFNEENTKKFVQQNLQYEFDKKETLARAEQERKDAIAEEEKQKQSIIRNSFIAGFALVMLLAVFIFRGYRNKQKANLIIQKQKDEVERAKNIIEHQKKEVEEKQKEILDSIYYARRIQTALITPEKYIERQLNKLNS